ncbi:MAG TPA: restriction endonuclease subunit S [Candidatus Baltobacteraceae bacterium]|nr:restriction endonuclease subunit S [Candidatus Baltobacteraceae bacterium]
MIRGWTEQRLDRIFKEIKQVVPVETTRLLTPSVVHGVIPQSELENKPQQALREGYEVLPAIKGDFVVSMSSWQYGFEYCGIEGGISPDYTLLRPICDPRLIGYLRFALKSEPLIQQLTLYRSGIRMGQRLQWNRIRYTRIALPPPDVGAQIAAFLERETKKADRLLQKYEALIALLKEKRSTLISHAVRKGLDPRAAMKPSGVDSIGDMPAHWECFPVKRYFNFLDGRRIPLSTDERTNRQGPYPYYGASGIIDHVDDYIFDEDLVLVAEDGANLLNRATPIAFVATGKYWVNNHAHILRPKDGNLGFWTARLEAEDLTPHVTGSAQPKLTVDALSRIKVTAPGTETERENVAQYVRTTDRQIGRVIDAVQRALDLTNEHISALVASAVTGQIDVRSYRAQDMEVVA